MQQVWNSSFRKDLIRLFGITRYYGVNINVRQYLKECFAKNMDDYDIVYNLVPRSSTENAARESRRGEDVAKILHSIVQDTRAEIKVQQYLDVGAGDGKITEAVGKRLNLKTDQTHAVDRKQWIGQSIKKAANVTFSYIDKKIKYDDSTFDLVTVFQALHHFRNLEQMLAEIRRVCKPGAVLIIREHDAFHKHIHTLIDVEHMLYAALSDRTPKEQYKQKYYGAYMSSTQWDAVLKTYGFSLVYKAKKKNPTRYYYAAYRL